NESQITSVSPPHLDVDVWEFIALAPRLRPQVLNPHSTDTDGSGTDVHANSVSAQEEAFYQRCSAPEEWIANGLTRFRVSQNQVPRDLRCPIAWIDVTVSGPLPANREPPKCGGFKFELGGQKVSHRRELSQERSSEG